MNIDNQFDGLKKIKRVDTPPFLFNRIKKQIALINNAPASLQWTWSYAAAAMVVLAVNMGILFIKLEKPEKTNMADVVNAMQLSTNNGFYNE